MPSPPPDPLRMLKLAMLAVALGALSLVAPVAPTAAGGTSQTTAEEHRALAREILAELVAIRTVEGTGATVEAAEALAARLRAAGFPEEDVQVVGPESDLGNLVARYRGDGSGGPPILLMAHLDVVDALPEDWNLDPFALIEEDGYLYGRGTDDNKAGAAIITASFIRLRQEGWVPNRDLIAVLTADEETTGASIAWLVEERRDLVDAAFALNSDAGGGELWDGEPTLFGVQASEKIYLTFQLEVNDPGGHSSRPRKENAIYRLAAALRRLEEFEFPVELNEVTRTYFQRSAAVEAGQVARDMRAVAAEPPDPEAARRLSDDSPFYNALLHTTCVATRLEAGHADNALPQTARATVNCRILPGNDPDDVEAALRETIADDAVALSRVNEPTPSPPSPLRDEVMEPIEELVAEMWPGNPVIPQMSTGATDGLYVRNAGIPVYGVSALYGDPNDARAHGQDERIGVEEFHDALEFWYRMLKAYTSRGG